MEKISDYDDNDNYIGRTQLSGRLIKDALTLAIKDVRGVARLGQKMKLNSNDGIKIFVEENGLTINVKLCVEYGYTVADVSYRVQETAVSTAAQLTDKKVAKVNITVIGTKVTKRSEEIKKSKKDQPENGANGK